MATYWERAARSVDPKVDPMFSLYHVHVCLYFQSFPVLVLRAGFGF